MRLRKRVECLAQRAGLREGGPCTTCPTSAFFEVAEDEEGRPADLRPLRQGRDGHLRRLPAGRPA